MQGVTGLLDCTWTDTVNLNADSLLASNIVQVSLWEVLCDVILHRETRPGLEGGIANGCIK